MLKPLILFEIIILLTIAMVIALVLVVKQRSLIKKLQTKFHQLTENASNQFGNLAVDNYFKRSIEETMSRYEKLTHSSTIIFDIHRPYSEKVTALRYLYLNLEQEAEILKRTQKIGWNFYENKLELLVDLMKQGQQDNYLRSQLDDYKAESQRTINKLKEIISSLQHSLQNSVTQLPEKIYRETIASIISDENLLKIKDLFDQMKLSYKQSGPHTNNNIQRSITTLEYEVENSDRYITNIKNNADQENIKLGEINKLKESNRIQRSTISSLESEIAALRDSIDVNSTQEIKDSKELEISRLERVVQEYEGCVIILEGQIDDLYSRLEEQSRQQILSTENTTGSSVDFNNLNTELENVSKRMNIIANDYRQAVALNRSIYNFCQCKTIKEIASNIVKLLKELDISAGFNIQSIAGKADYFPSLLFNDNLKKLVKNSNQKEHIGHLNGHNFFVAPRIKLIIFLPEEAADSINSTISGLTCIASENIQRLENNYLQKKNDSNIDGWISLAKNKIANIDIQFSYQSEESRKIFNEFISNLKKSYSLLDLKGEGAVILDNAINEYDSRMQLLLSGGEIIDREITKLVSHIGALKLQQNLTDH